VKLTPEPDPKYAEIASLRAEVAALAKERDRYRSESIEEWQRRAAESKEATMQRALAAEAEVARWKASVREVEAHLEASQKWGEQEQTNLRAAEARVAALEGALREVRLAHRRMPGAEDCYSDCVACRVRRALEESK
jgi:chromosome segregation ATPase